MLEKLYAEEYKSSDEEKHDDAVNNEDLNNTSGVRQAFKE